MTDQKLIYTTEQVSKENIKREEDKVIVEGLAIPFNSKSRNGVIYRDDSIKEKKDTLKGVSFLFNHQQDKPLGHVKDVGENEKGVIYTADLDPQEEAIIRKIERGDIKHASIGAMVKNPEFDEENEIVTVDVEEFVELSLVTVPGFKEASASRNVYELAEAFNNKKLKNKMEEKMKQEKDSKDKEEEQEEVTTDVEEEKENKELDEEVEEEEDKVEGEEEKKDDDDEEDDEEDEDEDEEEESKEQAKDKTVEERVNELNTEITELKEEQEELKNRLAIAETKIDSLVEEENKETEEPDPEETDEEFEEDKNVEPNEDKKEKVMDNKEKIDVKSLILNNKSY